VPLPTDFHFRSIFAIGSKASDFERYELGDDCSQNTNGEPRSAFRMVKLLSLGGATCHRFPLAVFFHNLKALRIHKRWELHEKCRKHTYSNSGSAYRLDMLLPLGGATYCWIPLWVCFATFESAHISELVNSVKDASKEYEYEAKVDLSIGQNVSFRWRHSPSIRCNDLFSRLTTFKSAYHSETVIAFHWLFLKKQQKSL
jgi:hypothetical protein